MRTGDELEPKEPESRWDHPAFLGLAILVFWIVVLIIIFGTLIALGVPFDR